MSRPFRTVHDAAFRARFAELWLTRPDLSSAGIGELLGVTKSAVGGLRQRMGLPTRGSPLGKRGAGSNPRKTRRKPEHEQVMAERPAHLVPAALAAPTASFRVCQYPTSEGRPWRFCDAPLEEGQRVYCTAHAAICWQPPPRKVPSWPRYPA